MALIKILFAVLIIICAIFYVLYIGDFSLVLLIVIAALPVIMLISVIIAKLNISVEFAVKEHTAAKNEPFDVQLCVKNRSIFPIGKAEAVIEYYNVFNNQINCIDLHFPIQAQNSQRVTFQLSSKFCGIINIRSAYITIYDPLRIFKARIGKNIQENIAILPEGHEISGTVSCTDRPNDESSMFSEHRAGDDPSEVFDLREYHAGDKPNRIHWKLSSKKDEFIVKDYSMPIDSPAAVFLDLHCTEDSEYTLPMYDTLLESLVSVSQLLIENERIHTIIYYNAAEDCFVQRIADSIDSLAAIISELVHSISDDLRAAPPDVFFSEGMNDGWTSFTLITAELSESTLAYMDGEIDADIKNAVVVTKDGNSADILEKPFLSLNMIPVVIGRITSSIRDIEL